MSVFYSYTCPECGFRQEASSDGHGYIACDKDERHYFYHPCEMLQIEEAARKFKECRGKSYSEIMEIALSRIGYEDDAICLDCAYSYRADRKSSSPPCPKCKSGNSTWLTELVGKRCPKCRSGTFPLGGKFEGVS